MAEEIKDKIAQVSEATELAIRRKTAEMLPDNPTAAGMKAADIKAAFYKGITDGELSILAEIARVITEANAVSANEKTARENADNALREDIMKAVVELDGALKSELSDAISGKLDRQSGNSAYKTVYVEGTEGEVELLRVSSAPVKNSIVSYDNNNHFTVAFPTAQNHPVTKSYFDTKKNNSLYSEVTDLTKRFSALESSSTYTVERSGKASAVQVENALPYGILSYIGGGVKTVTVGIPYDLTATGNIELLDNGFKMRKNFAYIKANIPAEKLVTVYADGGNGYQLGGFGLSTSSESGGVYQSKTAIGTQVTDEKGADYIVIYGAAGNTVNGFRISFAEPSAAVIVKTTFTLNIPEEITSLAGYGASGSRLDLTERRFYAAGDEDGVDVSAHLTAGCDIIPLMPGAVVCFADAKGAPVTADYEFTYKDKL
jgi:hypothetical protein